MRQIKYIVVHCSAGNQNNTAEDIRHYHCAVKGWRVPGYHYVVEKSGKVVPLVDEDKLSNGVKGRNAYCLNVCYVGGVDTSKPGMPAVDNRTPMQRVALRELLSTLKRKYPAAQIVGHRDFPEVHKACPSFDAKKEYADI